MLTRDEIVDRLLSYLDFGIAVGFYNKEEEKEIRTLESDYYRQLGE